MTLHKNKIEYLKHCIYVLSDIKHLNLTLYVWNFNGAYLYFIKCICIWNKKKIGLGILTCKTFVFEPLAATDPHPAL